MSLSQGMVYYNEGQRFKESAANLEFQGEFLLAHETYIKSINRFQSALRDIEFDRYKRGYRILAEKWLNECLKSSEEVKAKIPPPSIPPNYKLSNKKPTGPPSPAGDPEATKFQTLMKEAIMIERPNVHWDDVAGLTEAKRSLNETVILPIRFPQLYNDDNRSPTNAILLYGPPGTGKSFLAKAVATEAIQYTFITVSTSDLVSKWLGDSEKLIRALFETARANKPAIVFVDEIESLFSARGSNDSEASRRMQTEFLTQMDGVGRSLEGILFLAATNLPWLLDTAFRRRFERKIYIPLPDRAARLYLLQNKMKNTINTLKQKDFEAIAKHTEGFSGSDLKTLVREASMQSLRRLQDAHYFLQKDGKFYPCKQSTPGAVKQTMLETEPALLGVPPVTSLDFAKVLEKCKSTVAQADLAEYQKWTAQFGMEGN